MGLGGGRERIQARHRAESKLSNRALLVRRIPDGPRALRRGVGGNEPRIGTEPAFTVFESGAGLSFLLRASIFRGHRADSKDAGDGRESHTGARVSGPRL